MEDMVQEYLILYEKKPVEVTGGGAGAATIMVFWTMEGYDVGFIKSVSIVAVRIKLGGD